MASDLNLFVLGFGKLCDIEIGFKILKQRALCLLCL